MGVALTQQTQEMHVQADANKADATVLMPNQAAEKPEKKRFIDQLSMPAVLAAALTAFTSFMFSSKLGLTGSLIGAVLGAVVSTFASQVYNAMINDSVEKIQDITEQLTEHFQETQDTQQMAQLEHTLMREVPLELREGEVTDTARIAPEGMLEEAAQRRATVTKRRTFAVAVGCALAALLAYAIIVHVVTQGQGIGPQVEIVPTQQQVAKPQETTQTEESADAQQDAEQAQESTDTTDTTTQDQVDTTEQQTDTTQDQTPAQPEEQPTPQPETDTTSTDPAPTETPATDGGSDATSEPAADATSPEGAA